MIRQVVGNRLLSAGDDGAVRVWALAGSPSGKARKVIWVMWEKSLSRSPCRQRRGCVSTIYPPLLIHVMTLLMNAMSSMSSKQASFRHLHDRFAAASTVAGLQRCKMQAMMATPRPTLAHRCDDVLAGHNGAVWCVVAWGTSAASGGSDRTVRVLRL